MTGRDVPSDSMLTEALRKRVLSIEGPEGLERRRIGLAGALKSEKRFNRHGVTKPGKRHAKGKKVKGAAAAAGAGKGAAAAGTAGVAAGTAGAAGAAAAGTAATGAAAAGNGTAAAGSA